MTGFDFVITDINIDVYGGEWIIITFVNTCVLRCFKTDL